MEIKTRQFYNLIKDHPILFKNKHYHNVITILKWFSIDTLLIDEWKTE
jgi:hypothetical protein